MKLQAEYAATLQAYKDRFTVAQIEEYTQNVKAQGGYSSLETRIAWDMIHAAVGASAICGWYDKYNANDTHVTTLALRVYNDFMVA